MKRLRIKLVLISLFITAALLVALPRIPLRFNNPLLGLDSSIGGYKISLFGGTFVRDFSRFQQSRDILGSIQVTLFLDTSGVSEDVDLSTEVTKTTQLLSRRLALLGATDFEISTAYIDNNHLIYVDLPPGSDAASLVAPVTQSASLSFRTLVADVEWSAEKFADYVYDSSVWEDSGITHEDLVGLDILGNTPVSPESANSPPPEMPRMRLRFTEEGRQKFIDTANENVGKPVALYVNDSSFPISAPLVEESMPQNYTDDPVISGSFSLGAAKMLSMQINTGAPPYALEIVHETYVEPIMNLADLSKYYVPMLSAFGVFIVFMLIRYGKAGLLALISVLSSALVLLSLFKLVPVILSVGSLLGLVVSRLVFLVLMLLVLENVKKGVREGKPKNLAESLAFARAWRLARALFLVMLLGVVAGVFLRTFQSRNMGGALLAGIVSIYFGIFVQLRTFMDALEWHRNTP
jgi:protein-export membrane protein SecD